MIKQEDYELELFKSLQNTRNKMEYRSLVNNINMVSPGGKGGPGPDLMCDVATRAKYFDELANRELTGLETSEYNLTPYVN